MKFYRCTAIALAGCALFAGQSIADTAPPESIFHSSLPANSPTPWTSTRFNSHPGDFQFALVGDRTGLARPGVFEHAITRLNLLQPEFVVNVGDMIEGYTNDNEELKLEWDEQDARLSKLEMPFFRVVGNHDMGTNVMRTFWNDRYGADHYSFVYKNALFIVLNTEDPPTPMPPDMQKGFDQIRQLMRNDPEAGKAALAKAMANFSAKDREAMRDLASPANFSEDQINWVQRTLNDNKNVRWTFLFMHKPAWEMESPGFARIEKMLADRQYTVFGGHEHNYQHTVRFGHDYVRLGTVGGGIHHAPPGNLDHITLVNFRAGQPHIVNFPLDGVLDKDEPQQH